MAFVAGRVHVYVVTSGNLHMVSIDANFCDHDKATQTKHTRGHKRRRSRGCKGAPLVAANICVYFGVGDVHAWYVLVGNLYVVDNDAKHCGHKQGRRDIRPEQRTIT